MREILFKAKRIDNGEWVEGHLFDNGFGEKEKRYFVGTFIIKKYNGTACDKWNTTGIYFYEVDPETLCQFTGLCDKNGNKIWENDIFQYTDGTMVTQKDLIEYNETHASFVRLRNTEKLGLQYLWIDEATCNHGEVIGNIFDNKELLQEEHK